MKRGKGIVYRMIVYSGLASLFRLLWQRNRLTVLYYHSPDPAHLKEQLTYLTRFYNPVDLHTVDLFLRGELAELPHYAVLVTFDDGHESNALLTDVVRTFHIRPVIFLTSAYCNSSIPFWFKLSVLSEEEKERLKKVSDSQRRCAVEQLMNHFEGQHHGFALSWDQVEKMKPVFDFQSHTMTHPCLPQCDDDVARDEILQSKKRIEEMTGNEVFAMAYPNGDYGPRETNMLAEAGYRLAFTGRQGFVTRRSKPLSLNRLSTNDTIDRYDFIIRVCGFKAFLKRNLIPD